MADQLNKLQKEIEELKRQQQSIDERLKAVSRQLTAFKAGQAEQDMPVAAEEPVPPEISVAARPSSSSSNLESKIGGIWLNRVGVLIFILGAAFFLMYAFEQGWINELTRILVGVFTGLSLLAVGEIFRQRGYHVYAQGLSGGGIGLLYFSIFAAFYYYDIISPTIGLGLMILVTLGAVILSVYQDAPAVAILGLLTGFLNPILFVVREPQFIYLLLYLLFLNMGIIAVTFLKRWIFMGTTAFFVTQIYLIVVLIFRSTSPQLAPGAVNYQVFLSLFLLIFLALPFLIYTARQKQQPFLGIFLILVATASYYLLSLINLQLNFDGETGLFTLALAGFYLLSGLGLGRFLHRDSRVINTMLALTTALLFFFVPLQFVQPWITIGWLILAVACCVLGLLLANRMFRAEFWTVLAIALLHLISSEWSYYIAPDDYVFLWNRPAALTFLFMATLLLCAWLYSRYPKGRSEYPAPAINLLAASAGLLLLLFGSIEIVRYGGVLAELTGDRSYYHNMRMLFLSLFWTVFAVGLALAGFIARVPQLRFLAIALFGLTVLKTFLFDLSMLDLVYRIIALLFLGLVLLAVSYLYQRYRSRIDDSGA